MIFNIFFILFSVLAILEIIIIVIVKNFKKDFKWLIEKKDEKPKFDKIELKKFFENSYQKNYGWDRKPLSTGFEYSNKKTKFKITKNGYRGNFKFKKNLISVFGDSFAFCRYVNDNMTWESCLEKKIRQSVLNFGVGNFGLDQSFLKYQKFKNQISSKIIIFNVVPETIARINSYWKHYREFGNIYGFKPLLNIKNNNLIIKKNLIQSNYTEIQIHKELNKIKSNDIFFNLKFNKLSFRLPYSLIFIKNLNFFSEIFFNIFLFKITKKKKFFNNSINIVLTRNISESHEMYLQKKFKNRLKDLILYMDKKINNDNRKMVIIITPQLLDLEKGKCSNYQKFYKEISTKVHCLDLTNNIKRFSNYKELYLDDIYGGHLNEFGNAYIANKILKYLKNIKII